MKLRFREEEREMYPYCASSGIGLIPFSPLSQGMLARPVDAEATLRKDTFNKALGHLMPHPQEWELEIVRRVEKVAQAHEWKMAQVALAWVNAKVTSPIVGVTTVCSISL